MKNLFRIWMIICLSSSLMASRCRKESENCHKGLNASNNSDKAVYIWDYGNFDPNDYPGPSPIHTTERLNPGDQNIGILSGRGDHIK